MSFTDSLLLVAAVVTALGILIAASLRVYRVMSRIDQALGVDDQGRTVSDRLRRIEYQVYANGGESMFDRVRKLETGQVELRAEVRVVRDLLGEIADR